MIQTLACFPMANDRVFNAKLAALRAQYPYLEIQPLPLSVIAAFLDAGIERCVQLPASTQMIKFTSSATPFYVMLQGKAQIPVTGNDVTKPGVLANPQGWYYVAEVGQVSLIAPANTIVSIHCHIQQ